MTKHTQIYVVEGTTGEYSDRTEWYVAAYFDEQKAQSHAVLAKAWAVEHTKEWEESDYSNRPRNPYDDKMRIDYTGVDYTAFSIPILYEVPAVNVIS